MFYFDRTTVPMKITFRDFIIFRFFVKFDKINLPQDQKDELVLAIAEAAQNIVKHGYKGVDNTTDRMQIKISMKDSELEIGFFDKGKAVVPENVQHRKLDDIKPGGLGTFFIKQIMDAAVFKKDEKGWVCLLYTSPSPRDS